MINRCFKKKISFILTVCSYHVTYALSESTLYSCLNVKELLARSRREIWSLSDCNWTRTDYHLVHKRTLNHLAKMTKWLSVRLWIKWLWVQVRLQSLKFYLGLSGKKIEEKCSKEVLYSDIFSHCWIGVAAQILTPNNLEQAKYTFPDVSVKKNHWGD